MNKYPHTYDLQTNFDHPQVNLMESPTPIIKLNKLGKLINLSNLWLKSENSSGKLFGSNKIRNLEFLLGDIISCKKINKIVAFGSYESNFARAIAIYGDDLGINVKLFLCNLSETTDELIKTHLQIFSKYNAQVIHASKSKCFFLEYISRTFTNNIAFPNEYWIPFGGASAIGCLGHLKATFELIDQYQNLNIPLPELIFIPVGSGGTIAGLLAGFSLLKVNIKIIGVYVTSGPSKSRIINLANKTLKLAVGQSNKLFHSEVNYDLIELINSYKNNSYGSKDANSCKAAKICLDTENVYLDSTYSAKAMSVLMNYARKCSIDVPILFWNTSNTIKI